MMVKTTKMTKNIPAEKNKKKSELPSQVTITYDLFDLPTAQHKAGLAGLLLQIESMKNRKLPAPTYRWDDECSRAKVHIDFSEETTTALFEDLYDADLIEGPAREKPFTKGKGDSKQIVPPVRRIPMTKTDKKGKETIVEGYVYLELTPALRTLRHYLPEKGDWVRLWRDLIWQIIREGRKKAPYIKCAAKKGKMIEGDVPDTSDGNEADSAEPSGSKADGSTWADVKKIAVAQLAGDFVIGRLSGALLLGAMSENAETLPLYSRIEHSLLLHFWPLAMLVFVPRFVDLDGESYIGRRNSKDKDPHFTIAIPDVADLRSFIQDYRRLLASLGTDMAGIRPYESVVDIPAESGFSFIEHLAKLIPQKVAATEISFSINGVEYYHVTKNGNNVKFLSTGRVAYSPHLAESYHGIVRSTKNPLFRRSLMIHLLENVPWFQPFGESFAKWPHKFFVPCDDSPKMSWFWADARKKFKEVIDNMNNDSQSPSDPDDKLAKLVHQVVRTYVNAKAEKRPGVNLEDFRSQNRINWDQVPEAKKDTFNKARGEIAQSLFMEYRSRHDQAFISHFVARLGAVKQYLSEDDYTTISHALMTRCEDVKTLTLLALSANS